MPAPMMMASKSGIGVTPEPVFTCLVGCKTIRSCVAGQTPQRRVAGLQVCRRAVQPCFTQSGFTQGGIYPYRQARIVPQAAAERGEDSEWYRHSSAS